MNMARKTTQVPAMVLTPEEIREITELASKKLKRKTNITKSMSVAYHQIIADGKNVSDTIERIENFRRTLANNTNSSINDVKIKRSYYNSNTITFFVTREETIEEFNKRVEISASKRINTANRIKRSRLIEAEQERERKKAMLIKAVEELGPEIYEIFEEIKLKEPK